MKMSGPKAERWWISICLVVVYCSPPLFMMLFGQFGVMFMPILLFHNAYYSLPALVFPSEYFPSESFGIIPTGMGYFLGFLFYGVVALSVSGLLLLILSVVRRRSYA